MLNSADTLSMSIKGVKVLLVDKLNVDRVMKLKRRVDYGMTGW